MLGHEESLQGHQCFWGLRFGPGLTASTNAILFLGGFEKREDPVQSHLRPDPSEAFDCLDSHIPSFTFHALQQQ